MFSEDVVFGDRSFRRRPTTAGLCRLPFLDFPAPAPPTGTPGAGLESGEVDPRLGKKTKVEYEEGVTSLRPSKTTTGSSTVVVIFRPGTVRRNGDTLVRPD